MKNTELEWVDVKNWRRNGRWLAGGAATQDFGAKMHAYAARRRQAREDEHLGGREKKKDCYELHSGFLSEVF